MSRLGDAWSTRLTKRGHLLPQNCPMANALKNTFDLCLAYPQWQGSGRHQNLARGAAATADVCAHHAAGALQVPLSHAEGDGHGVRRWDAIFAQFQSAQALLTRAGVDRVLTAGGDCAVDIAVIDYLNSRHGAMQVVWIDAHLDGNTPQTSPSGSFHGMPVAAILGRAPPPMQRCLGAPLDPDQFRYFGIQVGDDGDWALQRELGLQLLDPQQACSGPVHIHFDLDVLDPQAFPHLAYTDGCLSVDAALALLRRISEGAEVVGLTLTEFSPVDASAAAHGSRIIAQLCEAVARR